MVDQTPREVIRTKLGLALLPPARPTRLWAGNGAGEPCSGCDGTIKPGAIMYEWDDSARGQKFRLHHGCYEIWIEEIERRSPGV
jgi:hypothetical protein